MNSNSSAEQVDIFMNELRSLMKKHGATLTFSVQMPDDLSCDGEQFTVTIFNESTEISNGSWSLDVHEIDNYFSNRKLLQPGDIFDMFLDTDQDLVLRLTDEYMRDQDFIGATNLYDAFESIRCNTEWELVTADHLGGLSEAPCFCESVDWDDDHSVILSTGRVWAYIDYQVSNPLERLIKDGEVIFTKAED